MPKSLIKGARVFAKQVLEYLKAITPIEGSGIAINQMPDGLQIEAKDLSRASLLPRHPFQLVDQSTEDQHNIRVILGTVNGEEPDGFSMGDNPPFVLEDVGDDGVVFVHVVVDLDTGDLTTVEVDFDESTPANGTASFYFELGSFSTTDDAFGVSSVVAGSLFFELCGGLIPLWGAV